MSRPLSPFELIHAVVCETTVMSVLVAGELDRAALARAWDHLQQENPVLTARIEFGPEGLLLTADGATMTTPSSGRVDPVHITTTPIAFGTPVAGLDVTPSGAGEHRVALLTHHSIADGPLMFDWFRTLWLTYTQIVAGATISEPAPRPLPAAPESLLADRGVVKGARSGAERLDGVTVHPFRDPVGRTPGTDPFALHRVVTELSAEETATLRASAKAHQETLHGLICGAVLLAERELLDVEGAVPLGLISHVNIRTRLQPPAANPDGTNVQGHSCAQVAVTPGDDPLAIGRQILDQLHTDLDEGVVQQTSLHITDIITRWASNDNLEPISVSNVGEFESLSLPDGLQVMDFQVRGNGYYGVLAGDAPPESLPLSTGRNHAVFSYDGRLNIQTTYPAAVLTAERTQQFAGRIRSHLLGL